MSSSASSLVSLLDGCPCGHPGWKKWEDACIEVLNYLFVPPLSPPKVQCRTLSGIDIRDAVYPNRNLGGNGNWDRLYQELGARMILFEFKNYDSQEIGKEEVIQAREYMRKPMGRLGFLCCNKAPCGAAHTKRNTVYSEDGNVILFLTKEHLREMLNIKERGEDPSDLIIDLLEWFYVEHE
ncbi:MAG TPA: hypothetical protein VFE33_31160 [Thermoanaerobaculia bacterium]|nr:hypothetical protein [Thermoanaerobaculia bacterium]